MGSIVLKSLSILLGVFFIFVGITKLSPFISKELHKDLVAYLIKSVKVYMGWELLSIPEQYTVPVGTRVKPWAEDILYFHSFIFPFPRKEYVRYAKVFPFTETLDFKLPSKWYRRTVGALEIIFGLTLAAVPSHKVKNTANIGLLLLMILAAYSHVMVGDPFDRCAPALVFFFMLSGRLVVWYQTSRREELEKAAATQNGNGLKRD